MLLDASTAVAIQLAIKMNGGRATNISIVTACDLAAHDCYRVASHAAGAGGAVNLARIIWRPKSRIRRPKFNVIVTRPVQLNWTLRMDNAESLKPALADIPTACDYLGGISRSLLYRDYLAKLETVQLGGPR